MVQGNLSLRALLYLYMITPFAPDAFQSLLMPLFHLLARQQKVVPQCQILSKDNVGLKQQH